MIDPRTRQAAQRALQLLCKQYGMEVGEPYGPELHFEWDWSDAGTPHPAIVWEGGPPEWPIYFPHGGRNDLNYQVPSVSDDPIWTEFWCEPGTYWYTSIYPL